MPEMTRMTPLRNLHSRFYRPMRLRLQHFNEAGVVPPPLIFGQDLTCRYLQPAGVIVLPGGHAGFAVGFAGG